MNNTPELCEFLEPHTRQCWMIRARGHMLYNYPHDGHFILTAGSSLNLRLPAHVNICTQNFSLKESSKNYAIKTFLKYVLCSWINSSDVHKKMTLRQNILISSISMISVIRTIVVGCKSQFQLDKNMTFLFYSLHNSDNRQYSLLRTPHN